MTLATNNPAFALPHSDDVALDARAGLIAEFDMVTYNSATVLADISGNGNHATFPAAPTVNAQGTVFTGTEYADFVLPSALLKNYSVVVVVKSAYAGYYIGGSWNQTQLAGTAIRAHSSSGLTVTSGISSNTIIAIDGPDTVNYRHVVAKVLSNAAFRARTLNSGVLGYRNGLRPLKNAELDTRTRWRIGAVAQTVDADTDAPLSPLNSGTIAWFALYGRATSDAQDAAIYAYLKAKMAARSITI